MKLNFQKIEKGRAKEAYEFVKEATEKSKGNLSKEYKSYVKKIPSMILNNGLGQTIAFIYSKKSKGNAYEMIYQQLNRHLEGMSSINHKKTSHQELVEYIINLNSYEYRHVQQEFLALFNWMRRFAEGMIEGEKS